MSDTSTHLGLPYLLAAQAQKHVTHNEALRLLDAMVQLSVLDRTRTTPPASPADGDRHLVASGATALWAGWDLNIAIRVYHNGHTMQIAHFFKLSGCAISHFPVVLFGKFYHSMCFTQTVIAPYHYGRTALPFFMELVVAVENMLKEFIELCCVYVLTELGHGC